MNNGLTSMTHKISHVDVLNMIVETLEQDFIRQPTAVPAEKITAYALTLIARKMLTSV